MREGGELLTTADLDRGAFACSLSRGDDPHLFVVTQAWGEPDSSKPSGRVVTVPGLRRGQAVTSHDSGLRLAPLDYA